MLQLHRRSSVRQETITCKRLDTLLFLVQAYFIDLCTQLDGNTNVSQENPKTRRSFIYKKTGSKCTENRTKLKRLRSSWAGLKRINFDGANLRSCKLAEANLSNCSFREANLSEASLWRANLRNSILDGAELRGTDLEWCNLEGCTVKDVRMQRTILPLQLMSREQWDEAIRTGDRLQLRTPTAHQ